MSMSDYRLTLALRRYQGCDPDSCCKHERQHTSMDCYPRYVELEYEGPDGGEVMTFEQWLEV